MLSSNPLKNVWLYKLNSRPLLLHTLKSFKVIKTLLLLLLLSILLITSGCASSSPIVLPSAQEQVVVDTLLMTEPNYTERLLKLLSE